MSGRPSGWPRSAWKPTAGRDELRTECAAALQRIRGRGESVAAIAALANASVTEVRSYLKTARARGDASPQPLGAGADEDLAAPARTTNTSGGDVGIGA